MGIWESLYRNMDYAPFNTTGSWRIEVGDNQVHNSNYCYLDRNNTRFHLNKSGWYRVNMIMLLEDVMDQRIIFMVWKNDVQVLTWEVLGNDTLIYAQLETSFYISSNGTNYYDFNLWNWSGGGSFFIYLGQGSNQLVIEYVGEY